MPSSQLNPSENKKNKMIKKNYKRTSRHLSEETKDKIRKAMTGIKKSDRNKKNISNSMKTYWNNPDNFPDDFWLSTHLRTYFAKMSFFLYT